MGQNYDLTREYNLCKKIKNGIYSKILSYINVYQ